VKDSNGIPHYSYNYDSLSIQYSSTMEQQTDSDVAFPPKKRKRQEGKQRNPRILLGVTGSVAAVKAPELALRLSRDLKMDVRIVLTRGGKNFWNKSGDYNPEYWTEVQERLNRSSGNEKEKKHETNGGRQASVVVGNRDKEEEEGTIQLHGKNIRRSFRFLFRSLNLCSCVLTVALFLSV